MSIADLPRQITTAWKTKLRMLGTGARRRGVIGPVQLGAALGVIALLIAYLALEWASFIHEHKGIPVTPWNPALGLLFAVMLLKGILYGFVLFAGVVIAEVFVVRTQLPWAIVLAMAALLAGSFAAAAAASRRYFHFDRGLNHVRDILILLAAGTIAAAISTALLSALLLAADELTTGDLAQSSLPLFVGDIMGIAVITPLVLRLCLRWPDLASGPLLEALPELILYVIVVTATLWLSVSLGSAANSKFLSLLFLPVVAAALRYGIDGSCAALAATQLGLVVLLHRLGHDAAAFTEFQVVMLALTASGLVIGVVVSERQRADLAAQAAEARLKEMQAQAGRAARLNVVSGMASALAHEINQPMTAARALARSVQQILRTPTADTGRADGNLAVLIAQIDHASAVVRRMREFLRRGQPRFSTLNIGEVLDDALMLAGPDAAGKQIAIELVVDEALPPIFGDRVQLQQVVLNLIHNAVEAVMESGRSDGRIGVSAHLSERDAVIQIGVVDTGVGAPAGQLLFEPQTSRKKDGLGLGLSICASIVEAHGGRLWLHSSVKGATELRFALPLERREPKTP